MHNNTLLLKYSIVIPPCYGVHVVSDPVVDPWCPNDRVKYGRTLIYQAIHPISTPYCNQQITEHRIIACTLYCMQYTVYTQQTTTSLHHDSAQTGLLAERRDVINRWRRFASNEFS